MIKLYHPSNKKFQIVKVKYFGEHHYTFGDVKASPIKRTFWYFTPDIPEHRFKNVRYLYEIEINENELYDLRKDVFNLINNSNSIHDLLLWTKKFYKGVIYSLGNYDMVILFEDVKAKRRRNEKRKVVF